MQRGKLLRTPLSERHRLRYTRDFLELIYAKGRRAPWIQQGFWEYFTGVFHNQATSAAAKQWAQIMGATALWNWPMIQLQLREEFELMLAPHMKGDEIQVIGAARSISRWQGPDGVRYLHYGPTLPKGLKPEDVVTLALDQVLSDLSGLAEDALGRCEKCGHYFLRLRGTKKRFCSVSCQWKAFSESRGKPRIGGKRRRSASRKPAVTGVGTQSK